MERFSPKMSGIHWDGVLHTSNVQNAYTMFYNEFCDVYNTSTESTEKLGILSMKQSINSTGIIS